jgi:hypothetical protein
MTSEWSLTCSIMLTNLWITFLLLKCYVGHVGYVVMGKKSLPIPVRAPIPNIIAILITQNENFNFR